MIRLAEEWEQSAKSGIYSMGAADQVSLNAVNHDPEGLSEAELLSLPPAVLEKLYPDAYALLLKKRNDKDNDSVADEADEKRKIQESKDNQAYGLFEAFGGQKVHLDIEAWNNEVINYGGALMTRQQSDKLNEFILTNRKSVIDKGVQTGVFEDRQDGEHFVGLVEESHDLKEKIEAQAQKGKPVSRADVERHRKLEEEISGNEAALGLALGMRNSAEISNKRERNPVFDKAPDLQEHFVRGLAVETGAPATAKPPQAKPVNVIQANGMD